MRGAITQRPEPMPTAEPFVPHHVSGTASRRLMELPRVYVWALLLFAALLASPPSRAIPSELPDIGDASATTLSPEAEARIGKLMMRSLYRAKLVVEEPALNDYIQSLGYQLASNSNSDRQSFTFFIVDDAAINAFAMPGGYIGVNAGLILASESENELASVLAHEISHITQHHLARSFEKANKMNLPMTAAVIAAIILGAHDPQAGQAALAASIAGSQQMQLDFTRANEHEADRVGIQLLAQAGFDSRGMAGFFERLQKETRYYGSGMPEFLSSHPVTTSRIAEAQDRSAQYPPITRRDSDNYHAVKALLRVRMSRDLGDLVERSRTNLNEGHYSHRDEEQFTYALALQAQSRSAEAVAQMSELLKRAPGRITYMLATAEMLQKSGKDAEARALYRKGLDLYPNNPLLTLGYAALLLESDEANSAVALLQQLTRAHPALAEGFLLLAKAESALDHQAASHVAYAEYYVLRNELHSAIDQLTLAQRSKPDDFYLTSRIEARLQQLKQSAQLAKTDTME